MTYQQLEAPYDRDNLDDWSPQTEADEFRDGYEVGREDALHRVSRAEFEALAAALDKGSVTFFRRLRSAAFLRNEPAAHSTLAQFNRLMFGPYGGGVHDAYAAGYMSAFETLAPFCVSTH